MSYAEQYQQMVQEFMAGLPDEIRDIVEQSFGEIMSADYGDNALNVGSTATDFTLPNMKGGQTQLSTLLEKGPVVITFYRGGWCPYCNLEFKSLHEILPQIKQHGATLIGISPELPDNSMNTIEKHKLQFEVLSDVGNKVADQYGLVMKIPEVIRPIYLEWEIDLPTLNGEDTWELPIPATYVINTDAKIVAAYVNKNHTERMEPSDIIEALEAL